MADLSFRLWAAFGTPLITASDKPTIRSGSTAHFSELKASRYMATAVLTAATAVSAISMIAWAREDRMNSSYRSFSQRTSSLNCSRPTYDSRSFSEWDILFFMNITPGNESFDTGVLGLVGFKLQSRSQKKNDPGGYEDRTVKRHWQLNLHPIFAA